MYSFFFHFPDQYRNTFISLVRSIAVWSFFFSLQKIFVQKEKKQTNKKKEWEQKKKRNEQSNRREKNSQTTKKKKNTLYIVCSNNSNKLEFVYSYAKVLFYTCKYIPHYIQIYVKKTNNTQ